MVSTMIERVVAANKRAWDEWPEPITTTNLAQVREAAARAAIAAMREPTGGMLAGTEAPGAWGAEPRFVVPVGYENGPIYREQCAEIYQTMIDAALEEKP